jgi:hypothetical protein
VGRGLDHRELGDPGKGLRLNGLPEDATERDILYGLDYVTGDRHFSSDKVRIARLRHDHSGKLSPFLSNLTLRYSTLPGRRIASVEFHRRSDAKQFLDQHYPDISFPLEHSRGPDSDPVTVRISAPSRDESDSSRDVRREEDDWDCINVCLLLVKLPASANETSVA